MVRKCEMWHSSHGPSCGPLMGHGKCQKCQVSVSSHMSFALGRLMRFLLYDTYYCRQHNNIDRSPSLMKVTPSSALIAFCLSSKHCIQRRHRHQGCVFFLRAAPNEPTSTDSNQPINPKSPSAEDKKDWFVDGRERRADLKLSLG